MLRSNYWSNSIFQSYIDEANEVHEWTIEMIKEAKKEGRD